MDLVVDNGKVIEPSAIKKAAATVTRDKDAIVVLSHKDIQGMVCDKLWRETPWLAKYKFARLGFNEGAGTFTLTFSVEKE